MVGWLWLACGVYGFVGMIRLLRATLKMDALAAPQDGLAFVALALFFGALGCVLTGVGLAQILDIGPPHLTQPQFTHLFEMMQNVLGIVLGLIAICIPWILYRRVRHELVEKYHDTPSLPTLLRAAKIAAGGATVVFACMDLSSLPLVAPFPFDISTTISTFALAGAVGGTMVGVVAAVVAICLRPRGGGEEGKG